MFGNMVEIFGYKFFEDEEAPKKVVKKPALQAAPHKLEKPKAVTPEKPKQGKPTEHRTNATPEGREKNRNKELVDKLVTAVISNPGQIQDIINKNYDKYTSLVDAPGFQEQVTYAANNVDYTVGNTKIKYIVILQIQAKFKYGLENSVDGIRSKACEEAIVRLQTEKSLQEYKNQLTDPLVGLKDLVKSKNWAKVEEELRTNASKYATYVQTADFDQKLSEAIANPQQNALILQLYGRFLLNDNSIRVDGVFGEQTRVLIEKYWNGSSEKERAERRATRQRVESEPQTKEEQITTSVSKKFVEGLSSEDTARYWKIFELPTDVLRSLISEKDQRGKTPEQIAAICEKRQDKLSEKAIKSAASWCLRYLQQLFNQSIQVDWGQENFQNALQNFDVNRDTDLHDQNIDFKVTIDGKEVSLCYDMVEGKINYSPSYFMDSKSGDITKGKEWFEIPFITTKIPSMTSLLEDAKKGVISSIDKPGQNNRVGINNAIKTITTPAVDITKNQVETAKNVAKESCMKTFLDITWYVLPQDLPKTMHENDQLYVMYDMFNRTFNNPNATAQDIYHLKNLLIRYQTIVNNYTDPSKATFKNMRNDQLSLDKIHKEKTNLLLPKLWTTPVQSLSFYNLFSQYTNPKLNITDAKYRVFDIKKMEADLAFYDTHTYLSDAVIRGAVTFDQERSEKENADEFLEKNWS